LKKSPATKARAGSAAKGKPKASIAKKMNASRKVAQAQPKATKATPTKNTPKGAKAALVTAAKPDRARRPVAKPVRTSARPAAAPPKPAMNRASVAPAVQAVVIAPPDNGKPRKNAAGFSNKELEHFRELLLAKRREILGDLRSMEHEALRSSGGSNLSNLPIHMADMGTDNYEQEFTLGLVEKDRQMLREINAALLKIQTGTFGMCEALGKPINKERLEYQPWARFSIEHARKLERMGRPGGTL
jgi:RNA polymerase-binding transcription factor DksA